MPAGSSISPRSGKHSSPPFTRITSLTIYRPSPIPPCRRLKNGVMRSSGVSVPKPGPLSATMMARASTKFCRGTDVKVLLSRLLHFKPMNTIVDQVRDRRDQHLLRPRKRKVRASGIRVVCQRDFVPTESQFRAKSRFLDNGNGARSCSPRILQEIGYRTHCPVKTLNKILDSIGRGLCPDCFPQFTQDLLGCMKHESER